MKTVVIYSGGLDSTVLLYLFRSKGFEVLCLGVDYGQRHKCELEAGARIAESLGLVYRTADLSSLKPFLAGNALTSEELEVPEGHYTGNSMKATVVPNRNMIMLSVAIGWAVSTKSQAVAYAAHAGDHTIYPDCRPEFVQALREAANLCDWHPVELLTPFNEKTKADIVKLGVELMVPFEKTWSCYKGGKYHCGKCGTCVERKEAFAEAGVEDPTQYS